MSLFYLTTYLTTRYQKNLIYTPEGNNGYLLNCPGTLSCYVIAGELCKEEGYTTISSKEYNLSTNIVNRWVILCK